MKRLYEEAIKNNDEKMIRFYEKILDVYDEFGINGHIKVNKTTKAVAIEPAFNLTKREKIKKKILMGIKCLHKN